MIGGFLVLHCGEFIAAFSLRGREESRVPQAWVQRNQASVNRCFYCYFLSAS